MSSHDGSRSVRQSKRYSVTALYLSMSAKDKELEIEDDLARGMSAMFKSFHLSVLVRRLTRSSTESIARIKGKDFVSVQEELCSGKGCAIS